MILTGLKARMVGEGWAVAVGWLVSVGSGGSGVAVSVGWGAAWVWGGGEHMFHIPRVAVTASAVMAR